MRSEFIFFAVLILTGAAAGQAQNPSSNRDTRQPMTGMSNMKDRPMNGVDNSEAGAHVMHSMEGHMDIGPHMKMTSLRPTKTGDRERSQQVVEAARRAS